MRSIVMFAMLFAGLAAPVSDAGETEVEVSKKLDGKWLVVSGFNQGHKSDLPSGRLPQVIFGADTVVTLDADEKELYKATYKLDTSSQPYKIDMVTDMPNLPKSKALGILKFDGEQLRLTYSLPGGERPASFDAPRGSKTMVFSMKRDPASTHNQQAPSTSATEKPQTGNRVLVTSQSLLGGTIMNAKGESIGKVEELLISTDGELAHALVRVGGVVGIGSEQIAVPLSAFRLSPSKEEKRESWLTTSVDLKAAPRVETDELLELSDPGWLMQNATFFGVKLRVPKQATVVDVKRLIDQEVTGTGGESLAYLDEIVFEFGQSRQVGPLIAILGHGGVLGVGKEYVAVAFDRLTVVKGKDSSIRVSADLNVNRLGELQSVTPSDYPELRLQTVLQKISE